MDSKKAEQRFAAEQAVKKLKAEGRYFNYGRRTTLTGLGEIMKSVTTRDETSSKVEVSDIEEDSIDIGEA